MATICQRTGGLKDSENTHMIFVRSQVHQSSKFKGAFKSSVTKDSELVLFDVVFIDVPVSYVASFWDFKPLVSLSHWFVG